MLLHIIRGAQSYKDLRTVNSTVHDSFKLACSELGLLDDDNEWDNAISEASSWATGHQLRICLQKY